jgi:phosphatidylinositol-4,5-bisphosphate 3-kinase
MISETGHLFHIDFGHFLGNFKSKFGFKRERTPFVLTMEMAHVMGGHSAETSQFQRFEEYCTQAYNMVRKHGTFLINIFLMNLSAGINYLKIN